MTFANMVSYMQTVRHYFAKKCTKAGGKVLSFDTLNPMPELCANRC